MNLIVKGKLCSHSENINCNPSKCEYGYIAKYEIMHFQICFDILIFFNMLKDINNENDDKIGDIK